VGSPLRGVGILCSGGFSKRVLLKKTIWDNGLCLLARGVLLKGVTEAHLPRFSQGSES
jgi:hypothetical protein